MDLKLKDEVTKLLIENPGMSIGQIAKRTHNYYSYTHKVITEMERGGLLRIKKVTRNGRGETICEVSSDYKREWVLDLKRVVYSILKDAEVKAALVLTVTLLALVIAPQLESNQNGGVLSASQLETELLGTNLSESAPIDNTLEITILTAVAILISVYIIRKQLN